MSASPLQVLHIHREDLLPGVSFSMVEIPGGRFMMGDDEGVGYFWEVKPAHEVELDGFYMGEYPVTQALWEAIMGEDPSYFQGPRLPVEQVSWEDVEVFLEKLNMRLKLSGNRKYRLPTEAEWEYATRGGPFGQGYEYAGSKVLDEVGWYSVNSERQTREVGLKAPNELGLYDMSGNVWEWCQDWYSDKYYQECFDQGLVKNPKGPESGYYRVYRGGSWNNVASDCRVVVCSHWNPDFRGDDLGFRLSRTAL